MLMRSCLYNEDRIFLFGGRMLGPLLIKDKSGMTLMEIMITILILSVGVLSSMLYFTTVSASTELARSITIATTHAEYIFEEMRLRPTLSNITATNWTSWAAAEGLSTLNGEAVAVSYVSAGADPLDVTAGISWASRTGTKVLSLRTEFTK